jgi:hypothetical protein
MKLPENELQLRACAARAALEVTQRVFEETQSILSERERTALLLGARQVLRMITGIPDTGFDGPPNAVLMEVERQEAEEAG